MDAVDVIAAVLADDCVSELTRAVLIHTCVFAPHMRPARAALFWGKLWDRGAVEDEGSASFLASLRTHSSLTAPCTWFEHN